MSTIVTRAGKGSPLTNTELDSNFTNLNTDKLELSGGSLTGNLNLGDNVKAQFGAGDDLEIFSNGSTALLKAGNATSDIRIESDNRIVIADRGFNEAFAVFNDDSDVKLYHNGSLKIATTATGADITGVLTADGLTVDAVALNTTLKTWHSNTDAVQFQSGSLWNYSTSQLNLGQNEYYNGAYKYLTTGFATTYSQASGGHYFKTASSGSADATITWRNTLQIANNGDISLYNDSAAQGLFFDSSTSRLGLGVTNPSMPLHLYTASSDIATFDSTSTASNVYIRTTNAATGNKSALYFAPSNSVAGAYVLSEAVEDFTTDANRSAKLVFGTRNNGSWGERLRINADGSSVFSGAVTSTGLTVSTTYPKLQLNSTSGVARNFSVGTNNETFTIRNETASSDSLTISNANIVNIPQSLMVGSTTAPSAKLEVQGGTTYPAMKLSRDGGSAGTQGYTTYGHSAIGYSGGTGADTYIVSEHGFGFAVNAGTNALTITDTVRVGIGLDNPSRNLTVHGGAGYSILALQNDSTGSAAGDGFQIQLVGTDIYQFNYDTGFMLFGTGGQEAMRIDASRNLLVGKTSNSYNTAGAVLGSTGSSNFTRDGNPPVGMNRLSSDGSIINFAKDGTTVGSIGTQGGDLNIGTGACGIQFVDGVPALYPWTTTGNTTRDAAIDLGDSGARFKDLYLSGKSQADTYEFAQNSSATNATDAIYRATTATIAFKTGGSEKMRLSGGNLLVGKTASSFTTAGAEVQPSGRIELTRSGELMNLNRLGSDGILIRFFGSSALVGSIGTEGNDLSIGNGDAGLQFINGTQSVRPFNMTTNARLDNAIDLGMASTRFKDLYLSGGLRGDTTFKNNAGTTEYARFSGGNLLVGTTGANTYSSTVNTGVQIAPDFIGVARNQNTVMHLNRQGNDGTIVDFRTFGFVRGSVSISGSTTSYNTSSDERLKDNIIDAPIASEDIDAIQVRSFDWKADGEHQKYGMVAQELLEVAPDAVTQGDTPDDMMGVDYSKLVPMLIKEIQSLRQRVAQLEE